ncbi:hypothetical protein [Paraburkholderia dilworthii]|uniref:hypothetical protein n=1 Tax=Paraburkholderia dilworthii TaxID=948106 RepID=UPI000485254F|nr:hypothetical protein [Paraburkholderia dilworthii]
MKHWICVLLAASVSYACNSRTDDQMTSEDKHKQEILAAIKECANQGIRQDYNPGISYLKCHDGFMDMKFSGSNVKIGG